MDRYGAGLISLVTSVYNHIIFSVNKGYIPIVDFKNHNNLYFKDGRHYQDNTWEYFFKQPMGFDLDILSYSKDYIISENKHLLNRKINIIDSIEIPENNNKKLTKKQKQLKSNFQKYIKYNPEMEKILSERSKQILKNINLKKVLGVLYRGSDYTIRKPEGEFIQQSIDEAIKQAQNVLLKFKTLTHIYLATEDLNAYKAFKLYFGDKIIDNAQHRFDLRKSKKSICMEKVSRKDHQYNLGIEYLTSLYILSKTSYFLGGRCNGSLFVWLMNKNPFIWFSVKNIGRYPRKKQKLKYYKYQLLSKILIGKKKEYYKNKFNKMKAKNIQNKSVELKKSLQLFH